MFVIRRAIPDDVSTLVKLAKMVHFINLPADREIIDEKVAWSRQCFMLAAESDTHRSKRHAKAARRAAAGGGGGRAKAAPDVRANGHHGQLAEGLRGLTGKSPMFMFVMEERGTSDSGANVIGTAQIISQMGGPGQPNVSLKLTRREMFSQSLQVGVTHTVAQIHLDESSPTEVGGLILQPSFRSHRDRLGRFLSLVRFHFMGLHRDLFANKVVAEMMGPISADGRNPFWDHCARAFINLTYEEADRFCQESKEFILTLYPREPIYLTLIPPSARAVVGQVGPETLPARRMLERLGFRCDNTVDPFDAGPHLECETDKIGIVAQTDRARLAEAVDDPSSLKSHGMVSVMDDAGEFRAVETDFTADKHGGLVISAEAMSALAAEPGMEAGFTPLSKPARPGLTGNGAFAKPTKPMAKRSR